jgi:hypothetical protein
MAGMREQRRIVTYLDGLYPGGDLRRAKVNALRELHSPTLCFGDAAQSASREELSHRDATQSALMPSIPDKALKDEYDVIARSVRHDNTCAARDLLSKSCR